MLRCCFPFWGNMQKQINNLKKVMNYWMHANKRCLKSMLLPFDQKRKKSMLLPKKIRMSVWFDNKCIHEYTTHVLLTFRSLFFLSTTFSASHTYNFHLKKGKKCYSVRNNKMIFCSWKASYCKENHQEVNYDQRFEISVKFFFSNGYSSILLKQNIGLDLTFIL